MYSLSYLIGQVIELVGAALLYLYAMPPVLKKIKTVKDITNPTIIISDFNNPNSPEIVEHRKYIRNSRIGFICIFFGVLLQLPVAIKNICSENADKNTEYRKVECPKK